MVHVDLDDPGQGPAPDRRRRRTLTRGIVVALVLSAVLAVTARTVADRRETALLADHATLPGVSATLRHPLAETVRLEAGQLLAVAGDTVLTRRGSDVAGLAAVDAGSGALRWALDHVPPGLADLVGCSVPPDGRLAACEVGSPSSSVGHAVVHVDLADGATAATTPLPAGLVAWLPLDEDLVLAARQDGRLVVARVAPGTTTTDRGAPGVRWRVAVSLGGRDDARPLLVDATDGYVTVSGAVGAVLRSRDGALLGAWAPAPGYRRVDVVTGPAGFGVWRAQLRGRWYDPSGAPGAALLGGPVTERVSDGSAPQVVLTATPLLTAVDLRTGEVLWQRGDGASLQPSALPLRLDGLVVVPEPDGIHGIDVRTGEVRWSAQAPTTTQTLSARPLTDGRRLVVTDRDDAGTLVLRAIDLTTGRDVWTVPAPPSSAWVYGAGRRGVTQGGGDVVVLG